ncbi:MAG: 2,3-bisphosphoglycerate-independent phosphoglycerate mutase [Actinobacteria bacterium]|nr:MAG: 2,3-bisphosphoglycerate-independent phosphoglycerate mutase [Actinomycetota bacterium]
MRWFRRRAKAREEAAETEQASAAPEGPPPVPRPLVLIILDGWGAGKGGPGDATAVADTPRLDRLMEENPNTTLRASGLAVGLPKGQMGNSEVGHLNLGAGRIVYQDLTRISKAIEDGSFFDTPALVAACRRSIPGDGALHLLGLLSDGGVHSELSHLVALLELAKRQGQERVFMHLFLDGRDVPPQSALEYVAKLNEEIERIGVGAIATIGGRYYGMDRDKRWDRVKLAWEAIVHGQGETAASAEEAIEQSYAKDVVDEFVVPTVILGDDGEPTATVKDGDSIIFFNFRSDRGREMTWAFVKKSFDGFERGSVPDVFYVCMTEYDETLGNVPVAFPQQELTNTLADVLSMNFKRQFHIAETEKYAHVTFFFNGGIEEPKPGEDRLLVPSPKVATYDLQPEMSAYEVAREVEQAIRNNTYDVIIVNFANCDMVGHTGIMEAAVKAVEAVDECVGKVVDAAVAAGGECIILADHGNAEKMVDEDGGPFTAHTKDKVPCIYVTSRQVELREKGKLRDVAPTMLDILRIDKPPEMTGVTLIKPAEE